MIEKLNKICIKKIDQSYLFEIIKKNPGINSGRKNYVSQYKRILKNILLSKVYNLSSKRKSLNFCKSTSFEENNKFLSIIFKLK
jgi:hypothetical protein|tara:strand:+ start:2251 stop:2502 length:252 start_codon:yes stop_codon:yes gene_type:complete